MKRFFSLLIIILITFSLTACSSGGISTFTMPFSDMPRNLDPQVASSESEIFIITNTYDGLFEIIDGAVQNNLAEDYDVSNDGKTYTFYLKQDSVYSYSDSSTTSFNGVSVTAHDFVFAFQRLLDPSTSSPYAKDFLNIINAKEIYLNTKEPSTLGVTALDDYTLEINLEDADFNFISKLVSTATMPCNEEFFYYTKGAYGLTVEDILSNGPFRLNYISQDEEAVTILRVREDFSNNIDRIRISIDSASDVKNSYIQDSISGYFSFDDASADLTLTDEVAISSSNSSLAFNLYDETFSNENIRKALSYYAYAYQNSGANLDLLTPSFSIFPVDMVFYDYPINEQIPSVMPDYLSENPKDLLLNGYNELNISAIPSKTILIPSDSKYTEIYENIHQLWQKELNVFFTVEMIPTAEIISRVDSGDFDIAFSLFTSSENNPFSTIKEFSDYNENYASLDNTTNLDIMIRNITLSQSDIINDALIAPIAYEYTYFYHKDYFDNIYVDPFGYTVNLKYASAN